MDELSHLPLMVANLAAAFVLGLPVGWEREHRGLSPGLRTYPLLSMGACAFLQIGEHAFPENIDAQARVFQALVSGVGFIGAGAIIKGRVEVYGLATAVSLWVTVAVGIAVAYELYVLAAVLSFTTLLALEALRPLMKEDTDKRPRDRVEDD
jgi:putative Mg2+ transporter-C (MgtC) family protein